MSNRTNQVEVKVPRVEFLDQADFDHFIRYVEDRNLVQVSRKFPPYQRDVAHWAEDARATAFEAQYGQVTGLLRSVVAEAVERAYRVELAGLIVDASGQAEFGVEPDLIAQMKQPAALYAKCLGAQAIKNVIEANLKELTAELGASQ